MNKLNYSLSELLKEFQEPEWLIGKPISALAAEKFKEIKAEIEKCLGKCIKSVRLDYGDEYFLREFREYLLDNGITSQLFAPGMLQQNSVIKRMNMTLVEMVRFMMGYSDLLDFFWGYFRNNSIYS